MTRANKQTWTMRSSYSRGMRGTKKEETFLGEKLIPRANACQEYDFHSNRILLKIYQVLPSFGKRNLHAIERERERERTRGREKKERKKEIQGLQHPLSPASKRRQKGRRAGFLRRPEARPYLACVNRNPYLCLSSTSTSVTPRHGGPRRGNRTKGKREDREGGGG